MDGVLGILKSIITTDKNVCQLYLNALDEHQHFTLKHEEQIENIIQSISSLLAKRESRQLGLILLNNFLDQCKNRELLERKGHIWIAFVLKAVNSTSERQSYGALIYNVIGKFAEKAFLSSDLQKTFISNHLNKVYESLNLELEEHPAPVLRCVATCLHLYAGSSSLLRKNIEQYVLSFIDSTDDETTKYAAESMHYLQQVRQFRETNCKTQWQNYQLNLLGSLHAIFDEAFSKCTELHNEPNQINNTLNVPALTLSDEPIKRTAQLFIRFHNLVSYLQITLRKPFPVEKQILPKKIINIIHRGLSMTCPTVMLNGISDNLALTVLIPKIHYDLLCLLEDVILVLGSHLKIYHELILGLLVDTLKWSSSKSIGIKKPLSKLRSKAYEVIKLWTSVMGNGSRCDTIAEFLLTEIIVDISPYPTELILKVLSNGGKHLSKKARRQFQKAQNEQSHIAQERNVVKKDHLSDESNQLLCIAALACLNNVLLSTSGFIRPTILKVTYDKIVQICSCFYQNPFQQQDLYSNWKCRFEIYRCISIIIGASHHLSPPPTQVGINILQKAQWQDSNVYIREQCTTLLFYLEKIIHPQKDSLLFPIEARDVRNAFIKFGKEHLLNTSDYIELSETSNNEECDQNEEQQFITKYTDLEKKMETEMDRNSLCNLNSTNANNVDVNSISVPLNKHGENVTTRVVDSSEENNKTINQNLTDSNIETNDYNVLTPPILKKLRTEVPVTPDISKDTLRKQESTESSVFKETDEDVLMADIEATFVDELN